MSTTFLQHFYKCCRNVYKSNGKYHPIGIYIYIYIYIIGLSKFTRVIQIDYFFRRPPDDYLSFFSLIFLYRSSQKIKIKNKKRNIKVVQGMHYTPICTRLLQDGKDDEKSKGRKILHMKIAQNILSPQLRWALVWFSEGSIRIT